MTGLLQKRISKLLTPLKPRRSSSFRNNGAARNLTVSCTADQTTEDVLAQLQDVSQNKHVTVVVLREMIQRSDNVQLFTRIQDLLRESKYFSRVRAIHLVEPHVHSDQYRRWCFKKTNFLHRVRKEAKERNIEVTIHGTLILDSSDNDAQESPPQMAQNVSSWLSLLQQLPQDPDITSLWISLREEASVSSTDNGRRPSQLDLLQSPVRKVFQALVELFNADTRQWQFIHCHVLYHPQDDNNNDTIHEQQTQSLLEVAELFHIPVQVQWQAIAQESDETVASIRTRTTSAAVKRRGSVAANGKGQGVEDDNTSTTAGMDGSSGAFGLPSSR